MKYSIVLILLLLLNIYGCKPLTDPHNNVEEAVDLSIEWNRQYTDLEIDSFKTFDLKTTDQSFVRFVEGDTNVLWLFTPNLPFKKINLRDTSINYSDTFFEKLLGTGLNKDRVIVDSKEPNILWIAKPGHALIKYDSKTQSFTPTSLTVNHKLKITDNWVVAHRQNTLIFNKKTNQVDTLNHFNGQTIFSIIETKKFGLVINGQKYNPQVKTFELITEINNVKVPQMINYLIEKDSLVVFGMGKYNSKPNAIIKGYKLERDYRTMPKYRIIEDSSFWSYNDHIYKWNLIDRSFKRFNFYLPTQRVKTYVNDQQKYWIVSPKEIFSFDRKTESVNRHPSPKNGSKVLQSFVDSRYLYVLYDHSFCIYNKDYLNKQKKAYPAFEQETINKEYLAFIASMRLSECATLSEYNKRVQKIEEKYKAFLKEHPFREYKQVASNIYAFEQFREKVYQNVIKNEGLDSVFIEMNLPYLAQYLGTSGNFRRAFKLDSIIKGHHPELKKSLASNYYHSSGMDKINTYFKNIGLLEKTVSDLDSLAFLNIVAMKEIIYSSWFCGEGCGGCDHSLIIKEWKNFLRTNYNPELLDDAAFDLIQIGMLYDENTIGTSKIYETFLKNYPNSSKKYFVLKELLYIYQNYGYNGNKLQSVKRKKGNIVLQKIKNEFPDSLKINEFEQYEKIFGKTTNQI